MQDNVIEPSVEEIIETREKLLEASQKNPRKPFRMKHISHLDLDGYGATILSKLLMNHYIDGLMTLETKNILPNILLSELETTLDNIDDYDLVIVTDLSVNQQIIDLVKNHPGGNKVRIFDHHLCDVKELPDNFIITEDSPIYPNKATCATELYYNFIRTDRVYSLFTDDKMKRNMAYFVNCVRAYDTFEFWDSRNDPKETIDMTSYDAPRLNTLFHIIDRENEFQEYIMDFIENADSCSTLTTSNEKYPWISTVLRLEDEKNTKYVNAAIRRLVKTTFKYDIFHEGKIHKLDYKIGIVFAERSSTMIANTILETHEDLDLVAVVSNNKVSLYSGKNKDDVDAFDIAKLFGGGGHKKAAGFAIPYLNSAIFNMQHFEKIIECAGRLAPGTVSVHNKATYVNPNA